MIKAVIFDLNGVFIQSSKLSDRFLEKFGVPNDKFMPVLKEIMAKVRLPNAGNTFAYWKPYLEKWNTNLSEKEFFDFWFSAEKENFEMTNLARKLKQQGIRLFILSNNFVERANYYKENFAFLNELFEKKYYSWQTGFVKPDVHAYQNILTENNLKSEEYVYFDDSDINTQIAASLGIKSFIFLNASSTKKTIDSLN